LSGVAGVLLFDHSLDADVLVRHISGNMSHRGPDGIRHWSSGPVALAHCMLRTTPEAAADTQPLVDTQRGLVLAMDGRLDNRDELYNLLKPRFAKQGIPDSSYVLEAYLHWGDECTRYLLGDFAFAIWDLKHHRLFCARDVMGGVPFAYVLNDRLFAFASEWEALLGLPGVSAAPNEDRIAGMLVNEIVEFNDRRSWQQDILALMAGESMAVEGDGTSRINRFGKLMPAEARSYASDAEYQEHFLEVFGEAVRCRMRSPGKPAVMMSGGIDTAAIVAMLGRQIRDTGAGPINSYSAVDDDFESSLESQAIHEMAGLPGFNAHSVSVPSFTGMVSEEDLVNAAWARAHPVDNSVLIPVLMYLAASRNGDRVMLHGACGDLTLSTPLRYVSDYLLRGQFLHAWRECQSASKNHVYLRGGSPARNFALNASRAFVPPVLKRPIKRLLSSSRPVLETSIINPDFASRIRLVERLEAQASNLERSKAERTQQLIASTTSISARISARFGVEARDPWADRRVVEFFLGLPIEQKVRDGWTKYLVRSTFQDDLPPAVLWRRDKEHLGPRVTKLLMEKSRLLVESLFNEDLDAIKKYVDVDVARTTYARYRASKDGAERDIVFKLATLIIWMKRVDSAA
jgi:asparagine synthase (glutamine-hydrolysing)